MDPKGGLNSMEKKALSLLAENQTPISLSSSP
jgi:hypothetical protein